MSVSNSSVDEQYDPLSDTGKKAVAEAVRRIKEELEINRDMTEDMFRKVLREERGWAVKLVRDTATYILGILKHI
jgi:hypothetical protein